ncbi:MAG: hypothetical protein R3F38_13955 [Gammaproteobacteria bacterium]
MNRPLRPLMVFVPDESAYSLLHGSARTVCCDWYPVTAQRSFDGIPGEVFAGKGAISVASVMAEGQLQASGNLVSVGGPQFPGRIPVIINIRMTSLRRMRVRFGGAFGQAAI